MNNPFISILMPAYNAAAVLERSIASCLAQSDQDFELIIINDGSTDETSNLLNQLKENEEKILVFEQKNQGVAKARNFGLKQCKGKFITFLDADDTLHNQFIEQSKKIIQQENVDCIIYNHNQEINGQLVAFKEKNINRNNPFELTEAYPTVWAKVFRKKTIVKNKIQFYPANTLEDVFFVLDILLTEPSISFSSFKAYNYLFEEQSLSRKINLNILNQRQEIVSHFMQKHAEKSIEYTTFYLNRIIKQLFISTGNTLRKEEQKEAFILSKNYFKESTKALLNISSYKNIKELNSSIKNNKTKKALWITRLVLKLPEKVQGKIFLIINKIV